MTYHFFLKIPSLFAVVGRVQDGLQDSCRVFENAGNEAMQVPSQVLSVADRIVNRQINQTIRDFLQLFTLTMEVIVGMLNFITTVLNRMITCDVQMVLSGANVAVSSLNGLLSSSEAAFNKALEDMQISGMHWNSGSAAQIPAIDANGVASNIGNALQSLQTDMVSALVSLNNTVSNGFLQHAGNLILPSVNMPVLPLSFCDNMDYAAMETFERVLLGVLVLCIVACIAMLVFLWLRNALEIWLVNRQSNVGLKLISERLTVRDSYDDACTDAFYVARHPIQSQFIDFAARAFSSRRDADMLRWLLRYIIYPPSLVCFCFGGVGITAISAQILALNLAQNKVIPWIASFIENLAAMLTKSINSEIGRATTNFVLDANTAINNLQNDINTDVFGNIKTSISLVNGTINTVLGDLNSTLVQIFENSFSDLIEDCLDCMIISKIRRVQQGLTYINTFQITLPLVDPSLFYLNATDFSSLVNSSEQQLIGTYSAANNSWSGGYLTLILQEYEIRLIEEVPFTLRSSASGSFCWCLDFAGSDGQFTTRETKDGFLKGLHYIKNAFSMTAALLTLPRIPSKSRPDDDSAPPFSLQYFWSCISLKNAIAVIKALATGSERAGKR